MSDKIEDLTTEELEKEIERMKEYIFCQECADDFYYTRGNYFGDKQYLDDLEREYKKRKEG